MCGIFGVVNAVDAVSDLVNGLKKLEYRGYDSAGVATVEAGFISRRRTEGRIERLGELLNHEPLSGRTGIGHTRWATHGKPNTTNAHPHATERVAVVHNGIIENHDALRIELMGMGYEFQSETDTEVVPLLITNYLNEGYSPLDAVAATVQRLEGSYALAILFSEIADYIIVACQGSPLSVATLQDGACLSSDSLALTEFTNDVVHLVDGDIAELTPGMMKIFGPDGKRRMRAVVTIAHKHEALDKGSHEHFTHKEIYEQPAAMERTMRSFLEPGRAVVDMPGLPFSFADIARLQIVACGTSYYSGLVARNWFERIAGVPVELEVASEYRYREAPISRDTAFVFISQSGETADTLASLRYVREFGAPTVAIVNVAESAMAREADGVLLTKAGPEIGVASTKAFTAQLTVLAMMSLVAGRERGTIDPGQEKFLTSALMAVPYHVSTALTSEPEILDIARGMYQSSRAIFLGRGAHHALAMEGALKLKEISYIHAEGFAAGEMKHGPIALIEDGTPVIVSAHADRLLGKTLSNVEEVVSRGARVIMLTSTSAQLGQHQDYTVVRLPEVCEYWSPIVHVVPMQLLAYHAARLANRDVDKPRNLAKSVTVE